MKTKLVYVLTCAPEATYIEQALMAVWSARYWNPDAHIVLMVDDKTDAILTGKRAEILNYISEKIVVPFEDETLTPMYRSRWIKTQVRQMIQGDFLFIDCDTICCQSLESIDVLQNEIGAVYDSHVTLSEDISFDITRDMVLKIGLDLNEEKYYYSSGVIYAKDTLKVHQLYNRWHALWRYGVEEQNVSMDQPSFARANVEMGHLITSIPDVYNCVLYTQNSFIPNAKILHISSYQNPSFLFSKELMNFVKDRGLNSRMKYWLIHPMQTWMPFDFYILHSSLIERIKWIFQIEKAVDYLNSELSLIPENWCRINSRFENIIKYLFSHHMYRVGAFAWMVLKRIHVLKNRRFIKENICRK